MPRRKEPSDKPRQHAPNGSGTVTSRMVGKTKWWIAKVYDVDGRRRERWARTKAEAETERRKMLALRDQGVAPPVEKITVGHLLDEWLVIHQGQVSTASYANGLAYADRYIRPLLGAKRIRDLTVVDLARFYANLEAPGKVTRSKTKGLARSTIRDVRTFLGQAFEYARRRGYVLSSVVAASKAPKVPRKTPPVLGEPEIRRLLVEFAAERHAAALWLITLTGIRVGECLSLRWQDVDWGTPAITVTATVKRNQGITGETKRRASDRTIVLPAIACAWLKQQWERAGDVAGGDLLFPNARGKLGQPSMILRALDRAIARAKVPRLTTHQLRHNAASLLLADSRHTVNEVQELLGHSNPAFTLGRYGHLLPRRTGRTAATMDALFGDVGGNIGGKLDISKQSSESSDQGIGPVH